MILSYVGNSLEIRMFWNLTYLLFFFKSSYYFPPKTKNSAQEHPKKSFYKIELFPQNIYHNTIFGAAFIEMLGFNSPRTYSN